MRGNWQLTGAVTFYQSPVAFRQCLFQACRAEDALNTIRTTLQIANSVFNSSYSDALDADYCSVELHNTSFIDSGNDAVDVSGSSLKLHHVIVDGAGDKGISVGEHSWAKGDSVHIRRAEVALASKDQSEFVLDALTTEDCNVGCAVYQKKSEFAAATLIIGEWTQRGVQVPFLLESSSSLRIAGEHMEPNQDNVKSLLYGVKFGKTSEL